MDALDRSVTPLAAALSRPDRVFPTLTPAQIKRIAPHGRRRAIASGEVLVEVGQSPYLLETNRPGVVAVGDVRGGNIKRVASAVGEGSIAVAFVHQVLHQ
jgi:thioredoxin reductase